MIPSLAGTIRSADMSAGIIAHAIRISVPPSVLAYDEVYPAYSFDTSTVYTGLVPMGARMALPAGTNIGNLGLSTSQGTIIAQAALDYGFIIVDSNGGGIVLSTEAGISDPGLATYNPTIAADLTKIIKALYYVQVGQSSFVTQPPIITVAPPTGITVTWRSGFSGGIIPHTTSSGTVIADLAATAPVGSTITFSELGDPDSAFSVSGTTLLTASTFTANITHLCSVKAVDHA